MELAALRERVARDMHNELCHTLMALSIQIETMKQQARESMAALWRTLASLRAPQLGGQALGQALRRCAGRAGRLVCCFSG